MRPHDDELRLEELDDQIDWYARGQQAGGWPSSTTQLIQGLRRLHENEQADGQSVEEVWQRLVQRGAVPPALGQRRADAPPRQQSLSQPPPWHAANQPRRRWPLASRVTALVAALALVVLVGGLAVGLVLVRHQNSGVSLQATATPGQEAVISPSATTAATAHAPALAYIGKDDNVWTMSWPGGTPQQLTTAARGPNTYSGLAWSPDGSLLAFAKGVAFGATNASIIVLKPDGTLVTTVTIANLHGGIPFVWSPDSKMIAYRSLSNVTNGIYNAPLYGTLVMVDAHTGKTVKTVTYMAGRYGCDGDSGLKSPLVQEIQTVHHWNPEDQEDILAWSPDQRSILVGQECNSGPVAQVDLSSGATSPPFPYGGGYQPGGNLILGYWYDGTGTLTLGLTDLSGNQVRALVMEEPLANPPPYVLTLVDHSVWSSDGKSIYYEYDDGIGQVGVDGSNPHQMLKGTALDSDENATVLLLPSPSPNGQFLLYLKATGSNRVGNDGGSGDPTPVATPTIPLTTRWYVAQADGKNPVALPSGITEVAWQ